MNSGKRRVGIELIIIIRREESSKSVENLDIDFNTFITIK